MQYTYALASFVGARDGMAVELQDDAGEIVAEIFEDDETKQCVFTAFTSKPLPVQEVRGLLSRAAIEFPSAR